MVDSILAHYDRASRDQREAGERWYSEAGRVTRAIAAETGITPTRVTYTLAALSPRNPWLWNVADCYQFAVASRDGLERPTATTFERNRVAGWLAINGSRDPWESAAPKVKAFIAAILGDPDAVVVDTWAYRVATGEAPPRAGSFAARLYQPIALAYAEASLRRGVEPRVMQAVTWLVAQTEGTASNRRGRHDLVFKRDTPAFVRALMSQEGVH